jgi:hypothetical protein
MSGFTPGSWVAISDAGTYEVDADAGMLGCQPICRMGNVFTAKAANAHLIAAAPDLYEALMRCLNFIENNESEFGETLDSGDCARAALAKARGDAT